MPAPGTFGNLGRQNVPGPTYFEIDAALSRIFPINECWNSEVRGEAFYLTNSFRSNATVNSTNIPTALYFAQFGVFSTAAADPPDHAVGSREFVF